MSIKSKKKEFIGIDISDTTVEVVVLEKKGSKLKLAKLIKEPLLDDLINRGRIQRETKLKGFLKNLFKEQEIDFSNAEVVFGLPESQVYTYNVTIELDPKKKVDDGVHELAVMTVPIDEDDLIYNYKQISETGKEVELVLVAASRKVLQSWFNLFNQLDIVISSFDSEILAISRAVFDYEALKKSLIVLDIGAVVSNLAVFDNQGVRYTHSINHAGEQLTQQLAAKKGLSILDAESLKKEEGITKNTQDILVPGLEPIVVILKEAIEYYEGVYGKQVQKILLVGGTSLLKGLPEYLQEQTAKKVERALLDNSLLEEGTVPVEMFEAFGLALRPVIKKDEPYLVYSPSKGQSLDKSGFNQIDLGEDESHNTRKQIVLFLLLIVLGGIALYFSFSFRNKQREVRLQQQQDMQVE